MSEIETQRAQADLSKAQAEAIKVKRESQKEQAETSRLKAEAKKLKAEAQRLLAESRKIQQEVQTGRVQLGLDIVTAFNGSLDESRKMSYALMLAEQFEKLESSKLDLKKIDVDRASTNN